MSSARIANITSSTGFDTRRKLRTWFRKQNRLPNNYSEEQLAFLAGVTGRTQSQFISNFYRYVQTQYNEVADAHNAALAAAKAAAVAAAKEAKMLARQQEIAERAKQAAARKKIYDQARSRLKTIEARLQKLANGSVKRTAIDLIQYLKLHSAISTKEESFKSFLRVSDRVLHGKRALIIVTYANGDKREFTFNDLLKNKIIDIMAPMETAAFQKVENTFSDAAVEEIAGMSHNVIKIEFEIFEKQSKYSLAQGNFFKYLHNTTLDLTRYQVYARSSDVDPTNCFYYSLEQAGLSVTKLAQLKLFIQAGYTPVSAIPEICEKLDIQIALKKEGSKNGDTVFGNSTEKFTLCLVDQHYFVFDEHTGVTAFSLKNYDELCTLVDFQLISEKNGKYYKRVSRENTLDSFKLVRLLVSLKDSRLTFVTRSDITKTPFYSSVADDIQSLDYVEKEGTTFKEIKLAKPKESTHENIFFDFETATRNENGKLVHYPYLVCFDSDSLGSKSFYGEECGLSMLKYLSNRFANEKEKKLRFIAHNASYDIRFIFRHLKNVRRLSRGNKIISMFGVFQNLHIDFKDSYLLISSPLKAFSKMFGLSNEKEVISYDMYNQTDCVTKRYIPFATAIEWIKKENKDVDQFIKNAKKWKLVSGSEFDCIEYSAKYCEIDCKILKDGYNTFRKWQLEMTKFDIDAVLTMPSLAHNYFIASNCYDGVYELSGVPQQFIQKCVVGGRVMCSENKKNKLSGKPILDFDAVSLYPSAMRRMPGFLKGTPKVLSDTNFEAYKNFDGYFVEIEITNVGKHRKLPLLNYKNEDGIRVFTNDMVGKKILVDKVTLEDLIAFQQISFKTIRGYYFNEGFNNNINDTILKVFTERKNLKKQKNPAEIVYKLLMNSGYGKTVMKAVEHEIRTFNNENDLNAFCCRHFNWIESRTKITGCDSWEVKMVKPVDQHFNIAHVGASILSWSKRIMNEVICTAEDNGIDVFYQDTDSMHLYADDLPSLVEIYNNKYGRELVGKDLGQFHSDFDLCDETGAECDDVKASRSIFLGKKCYVDELVGTKHNGEKHVGYHIRMKGIPNSCIHYTAKKLGVTPFQLYEKLFDGEEIEFDLTEGKSKNTLFKYLSDMTVITQTDFARRIKF